MPPKKKLNPWRYRKAILGNNETTNTECDPDPSYSNSSINWSISSDKFLSLDKVNSRDSLMHN